MTNKDKFNDLSELVILSEKEFLKVINNNLKIAQAYIRTYTEEFQFYLRMKNDIKDHKETHNILFYFDNKSKELLYTKYEKRSKKR